MERSRIFLRWKGRRPDRSRARWLVELARADLLVLGWSIDFTRLTDVDQASALLREALGEQLLGRHRDERGVLLTPGSLPVVDAADYESAVRVYAPAGLWAPVRPWRSAEIASDASEVPLPRYPRSELVAIVPLESTRAMRELRLSAPPLYSGRLELVTRAALPDVSEFYLPRLGDLGLRVTRRVLSGGRGLELTGEHDALKAVVRGRRAVTARTSVVLSWALKR